MAANRFKHDIEAEEMAEARGNLIDAVGSFAILVAFSVLCWVFIHWVVK